MILKDLIYDLLICLVTFVIHVFKYVYETGISLLSVRFILIDKAIDNLLYLIQP